MSPLGLKGVGDMTTLARTRNFALPVMGHHPLASEYDAAKPVTLTGVVDRVSWENPHVHIFLNVKNEGGKTDGWQLENS
jgi:hypothetical protein